VYSAREHQPLSDCEVEESARACVAALEGEGQSGELALSEMSSHTQHGGVSSG
jgi:hypothetical protein